MLIKNGDFLLMFLILNEMYIYGISLDDNDFYSELLFKRKLGRGRVIKRVILYFVIIIIGFCENMIGGLIRFCKVCLVIIDLGFSKVFCYINEVFCEGVVEFCGVLDLFGIC